MSESRPANRIAPGSNASVPDPTTRTPRRSLKRHVLVGSLLLALVPMLLLAGQGYHCARAAVLDTATERLAELAASRRNQLELWLSERMADASFLARCPLVRRHALASNPSETTGAAASAYMAMFAAKNGYYEAIGLYDLSWRELASAGTEEHGLEDFELSDIMQAVRSATGPAVGRIHRHEDDQLGIHFGATLLDDEGEVAGYILTALDESRLKGALSGGAPKSAYHCYLVSSEGIMLTEAERHSGATALVASVDSEGFRRALAGEAGADVYLDPRGREVVGGFASIPSMDWILLMEQDAHEALAWLPELGWRAAITALVVAAATILLALGSARRTTAPLQRLADVADLVAKGHLDARAEPATQHEVNSVAAALNHMLNELANARQRVIQSATLAAMGEMSSAVVHEMRNPLSSIKLNLQAIRAKLEGDPRDSELAEIAQTQVLRLERMFSDLLSLSKPLRMNFRVLPVQGAVTAAMEAVSDQASRSGCRIRAKELDAGIRTKIDGDRLQQALVNLFQNAMHATGGGGTIAVVTRLDRARRRVLIDVTDDGPGVAEDNLERLFQPFFTTRAAGTGLGLAIVRKIVEYHGGQVTASNRDEASRGETGAVFRIELPHEPEQE